VLAPLAGLAAVAALALVASPAVAQSFEAEQRRHSRVEGAFQNHRDSVEERFAERGIPFPPREVFFRVIKRERILEIWARGDLESPFAWLENLDICYFSGRPGPKRREGDRQHPEGFYTIDRFNPTSRYHLSLRVSYPNASDAILSDPRTPGGDIYIHGGCGSTGCLAVTDPGTERLYVIAVLACSSGQTAIPIHTFPIRFDEESLAWLREFTVDRELWAFWENLRAGFDYFEQHRLVPGITVDPAGHYLFEPVH
jgi:murein L,D-transpeptidase YafK